MHQVQVLFQDGDWRRVEPFEESHPRRFRRDLQRIWDGKIAHRISLPAAPARRFKMSCADWYRTRRTHPRHSMAIDIDRLSEAELVDLNRRIVERLRFLYQMRAHATMLQFSLGNRVAFDTADGRVIVGTLMRYNKKSVTVITDDSERWNVSPGLLRRAEPRDITPTDCESIDLFPVKP